LWIELDISLFGFELDGVGGVFGDSLIFMAWNVFGDSDVLGVSGVLCGDFEYGVLCGDFEYVSVFSITESFEDVLSFELLWLSLLPFFLLLLRLFKK